MVPFQKKSDLINLLDNCKKTKYGNRHNTPM